MFATHKQNHSTDDVDKSCFHELDELNRIATLSRNHPDYAAPKTFMENNRDGCHQCDKFPCKLIDEFPVPVGKKIILRSVPARKKLGTKTWVKQEKACYECPQCNTHLFRGARRCSSWHCDKPQMFKIMQSWDINI